MTETSANEDHVLHFCHCGKWGSRGVGVRLLMGLTGTWYCAEHIADAKPVEIPMERAPRMTIPTRYLGTCELCGNELNTQAEGVHQWTSGWVLRRAGGGGHGISLPVRENRWAHRYCIENAGRGGQQQSML